VRKLELRIPPAAIALAAAVLMWIAARALPSLTFPVPGREPLALTFVLAGLLTAAAGVFEFHRARTTVNPLNPGAASALVVNGAYRLTRNPMYLGFAFMLLGLAIVLSNLPAALPVPAYVAYMNRFQILPEERALRARFGAEFEAYSARVRPWL